jgi:hypothetical protein
MTEEQIALAKRAVACKGWRWMPGMRWWTEDDRGRLDDFQLEYMGRPLYALPDLTDPATLGCLLALVREAHPRDRGLVPIDMGDGEWQVILKHERKWSHVVGKSEAEALVAALEAAP